MKISNQRGFAIAPILIWSLIITATAGSAYVYWFNQQLDIQSAQAAQEESSPVPVENLQMPSSKPSIKQQTIQQIIKHDGSRTGRIIDYHSLCEGKTIKVYENELVSYKRITGETIYTTKGDIKCYEDQINNLKNQAFGSQDSKPRGNNVVSVPCTTVFGPSTSYGNSYQEAQSRCEELQDYASQLKARNDQTLNDIKSGLEQVMNQKFESSYTPPSFKLDPPSQIIEPSSEPCILVPPGFGGSTNGRTNEYGYPCAN